MYGVGTLGAAGSGAATLATTGVETFWMAVTAVALISGGFLLHRLAPRKEF